MQQHLAYLDRPPQDAEERWCIKDDKHSQALHVQVQSTASLLFEVLYTLCKLDRKFKKHGLPAPLDNVLR
jgi:hypothetical protein